MPVPSILRWESHHLDQPFSVFSVLSVVSLVVRRGRGLP